jgi:tRNA pseudouridine38-40 synthase
LEASVLAATGQRTQVVGSGRTDAGVHALGQVVHFDASWRHSSTELLRALNARLPLDIAAQSMDVAEDEFHARFSARSRTYCYRILVAESRAPLRMPYVWHLPVHIDVSAMSAAASKLVGEHDFAAFGRPMLPGGETRRMLQAASVLKQGDEVVIELRANAFLRRMARRIVGLLVDVGLGRERAADAESYLDARSHRRAAYSAPAQGLCLVSVEYAGPRTMRARALAQEAA